MELAMKETKGVSLIELCIAAMVGIILIVSATSVVVWIFKMQVYFRNRANDDMSWITANEYLKKDMHGSSYVTITAPATLELHNYDDTVKGTYTNTGGSLQFSDGVNPATVFKNVAATFDRVYPAVPPADNKVLEVRVNYTSPSQLSSSLVLKCGVDLPNTWARTYGFSRLSTAGGSSVQKTTPDGGYIITGSFDGLVYLIKTDSSGVAKWSKTFGETITGNNYGHSVRQTFDGSYNPTGYIIAGSTTFGAGASDIYLVKTDPNGVIEWSKTFGNGNVENGESVWQTFDGSHNPTGYIIVGRQWLTTGTIYSDVYLIKTGTDGMAEWSKRFHVPGNDDWGYSVQQTADEGYIIAGSTGDPGSPPDLDVYLIKIEPGITGTIDWSRTFETSGGTFNDVGYSVRQTFDGSYNPTGYIIAGSTHLPPNGYPYAYLIKTGSDGVAEWSRTFGAGGEYSYSVQQTADGGYITVGLTSSFGAGNYDVYLIKTDSDGVAGWSRTFGGSFNDIGYSVQQDTDGGYIIVGQTGSFGAGSGPVYLIKTDSNGKCPQASAPYTDPSVPTYDPSVPTPGVGSVPANELDNPVPDSSAPVHDPSVPTPG
jgi:hypothetical protein